MASILFYGGVALNYEFGAAGSGLAFFSSAGFGGAIQVGAYNGRTYISNPAGTSMGPECNNVYYHSNISGVLGQAGSGLNLQNIPNAQATGRISFTNDAAVRTQNAKLIIYDRVNTPPEEHPATGVVSYVAWIVHTDPTQAPPGSGSVGWTEFSPTQTGVILYTVTANHSPGLNGTSPNSFNTSATQHDWYYAISVSPTSIGSKQFGLYFSVEYL